MISGHACATVHSVFIFQNPQLIGSISVLHNVLVPARLARKRGLEGEARRLLTTLGLSHAWNICPIN